jgi:hypothetical protein
VSFFLVRIGSSDAVANGILKTGATETPMKKNNKHADLQREADEELNPRLLTDEQIARKLGHGFTANSINRMRRARQIPVVRIGYRTLRYSLEDVIAALHRRTIKARF